jgi:hypothetical protein
LNRGLWLDRTYSYRGSEVLGMAERHVTGGPGSSDRGRGFLSTPSSKLGRWSVALAATFAVLFIITASASVKLPWFYGIAMLAPGLAAGIVGLIAVIGRHERSWLVWLAMLPGLTMVAFVVSEFLAPH